MRVPALAIATILQLAQFISADSAEEAVSAKRSQLRQKSSQQQQRRGQVAEPEPLSIYDTARSVARFSTVVTAVDAAGLAETLSSDGAYTVFAPVNQAFEKLDADLVAKLLDPVWQPQLKDLLLYHTLGSVVRSTDLVDGMTATTLNGEDITINLDPARVNEDSMILVGQDLVDIEASNGVVHGIDTVLSPRSLTSTIAEIGAETDTLSTLIAAVTAVDPALAAALSGDGPLTLFAPTNEAFEALGDETLQSLLLPENKATLIKILWYHVVGANAPSSSLESGEVPTLSGDSVMIDVSDTGVKVNEANVITPDIIANNGIIHIIDMVLIPPANCEFCPDGMDNPDLVLPTAGMETCAQAAAYARNLLASDAECQTVGLAQAFCCPDVPDAATTAAPPATEAPDDPATDAPTAPATAIAATEPADPATDATEPAGPATDATDPAPTEPADPVDTATDATDPAPTEPADPVDAATEPADPVDAATDATDAAPTELAVDTATDPAPTEPAVFGKSAKDSKAKSLKDTTMAKVAKVVSSSKSGKAKSSKAKDSEDFVVDAKAEKMQKSGKLSKKSGDMSKMTKTGKSKASGKGKAT